MRRVSFIELRESHFVELPHARDRSTGSSRWIGEEDSRASVAGEEGELAMDVRRVCYPASDTRTKSMPKKSAARARRAAGPCTLDRSSVVPLYHQLFIDLRRRLLAGEWRPGDPFPRDADLGEQYAVSRITVRQALSQLVDRHYIVRYRGRGSFVGNLPKEGARANHRLVAEEIRDGGRDPSHHNLGVERHRASEVTAEQLGIDVADEVDILKRLHLADGEPFCLESVTLPAARYPNAFERVIDDTESLRETYRRLGIVVVKAEQTVTAMIPSKERRKLLGIDYRVPVIYVERVGTSASGRPLEVRRLHYRSDNFALRQEIIWGEADTRIVDGRAALRAVHAGE